MRDRKIKTTACVLLAALLLGGCGEQPIELTEQEETDNCRLCSTCSIKV